MKYPSDQATLIMQLMGDDMEPALHISVHQFVRIIDIVKTKIMEFALDLEDKGILG